jgi:hypothetical protein
MGAPLEVKQSSPPPQGGTLRLFAAGPVAKTAGEFLGEYQKKIRTLPPVRGGILRFLEKLTEDERLLLTTLLPAGAALQRRRTELKGEAVLEAARSFYVEEIGRILGTS